MKNPKWVKPLAYIGLIGGLLGFIGRLLGVRVLAGSISIDQILFASPRLLQPGLLTAVLFAGLPLVGLWKIGDAPWRAKSSWFKAIRWAIVVFFVGWFVRLLVDYPQTGFIANSGVELLIEGIYLSALYIYGEEIVKNLSLRALGLSAVTTLIVGSLLLPVGLVVSFVSWLKALMESLVTEAKGKIPRLALVAFVIFDIGVLYLIVFSVFDPSVKALLKRIIDLLKLASLFDSFVAFFIGLLASIGPLLVVWWGYPKFVWFIQKGEIRVPKIAPIIYEVLSWLWIVLLVAFYSVFLYQIVVLAMHNWDLSVLYKGTGTLALAAQGGFFVLLTTVLTFVGIAALLYPARYKALKYKRLLVLASLGVVALATILSVLKLYVYISTFGFTAQRLWAVYWSVALAGVGITTLMVLISGQKSKEDPGLSRPFVNRATLTAAALFLFSFGVWLAIPFNLIVAMRNIADYKDRVHSLIVVFDEQVIPYAPLVAQDVQKREGKMVRDLYEYLVLTTNKQLIASMCAKNSAIGRALGYNVGLGIIESSFKTYWGDAICTRNSALIDKSRTALLEELKKRVPELARFDSSSIKLYCYSQRYGYIFSSENKEYIQSSIACDLTIEQPEHRWFRLIFYEKSGRINLRVHKEPDFPYPIRIQGGEVPPEVQPGPLVKDIGPID